MLVQQLSAHSGISEHQLSYLAKTASNRYFTFQIPKHSGGFRTIDHPSRRLKAVQRWITNYLLVKFPVHKCAAAYEAGCSIRKNAEHHKNSRYLVRIDFEDFFPSFKKSHITKFLKSAALARGMKLTPSDFAFVAAIVTKDGKLTIGSPTSPKLTNLMMFHFDSELATWCRERRLTYTRYADDIFISSKDKNTLRGVERAVSRIASRHYGLKINSQKTLHLSKRQHRSVTGVVLTSDGRASIGRELKRQIRTRVFLFKSGELSAPEIASLSGLLAHTYSVDRAFYNTLIAKFDQTSIDEVRRFSLDMPGD